jgi:hypothetical protein
MGVTIGPLRVPVAAKAVRVRVIGHPSPEGGFSGGVELVTSVDGIADLDYVVRHGFFLSSLLYRRSGVYVTNTRATLLVPCLVQG